MGDALKIVGTENIFPDDFLTHRTTDHSRWDDYFTTKSIVNDLDGKLNGSQLDPSSQTDITSQATSIGFTVVSEYGGEVDFTATNSEDGTIFGTVSVNGVVVSSTEGIAPNMPITQNIVVQKDDIVTCSNVSLVMFIPYISGGIDLSEVAMKYHTATGESMTGNLSMIYPGFDMSGATLVFDNSHYVHNDAPTIQFTDATTIGFDTTGKYSHFRADHSVIKVLFYSSWQVDFYTLGQNMVVMSVSNNQNQMSEDITFSTTVVDTVVDPAYNFHTKTNETDFVLHRTTDKNRWQDAYNSQHDTYVLIAETQGLTPDTLQDVDLSTYNSTDLQYTVTNQYGGLLELITSNPIGAYAELYINNELAYSTEGMMSDLSVTHYTVVSYNDVIYATNSDSFTFIPYIEDLSSPQQLMVNTINDQKSKITDLQNQIYDLQASIDNKTIANQTPIDITNQTYTVNNSLGARLSGQGVRTIGLLGITVLSTGIITMNGTEIYNNTSLLGVGDAEVLSINVPNGTVITSSGMQYVTIYNYVQGG